VLLALVAVVFALYGQTARHAFLSYDDGSYITENPHVAGGLTLANARWAFAEFHSANWHPLTWLSHQLDVSLFQLEAGRHHLVNAALHALNACLCFLFLRRATGALWPSALCALLFAVHPQRVESVAWAAERKDVLSGAFFFLTLLAYERYARAPSPARYAGVALALALGLLAKPMLVTLPAVLLLLDAWPLARAPGRPWRALVLEKLPLGALCLGSAALTWLAQSAGDAVRSTAVLGLAARLATAVLGTLAYLRQAVWPAGLCFFYPHPAFVAPETFAPLGPRVLLGFLGLGAATVGAFLLRRRAPAVLTGWLWMLLMLLPVIGIVQVGAQFHADRYAYLPLLGATLALVFGLDALVPAAADASRARRALFGLGLAAAAALAAVTARQVATWHDMHTLCERALAVTERNYVAHEHLALLLQKEGDLAGAESHYLSTLAIAPRLYDAHSNLGAVYMQLGRRAEARAQYEEALRLQPDFLDARLNWGMLCELEDDLVGAEAHYERATREHPESAAAWLKLGDVALRTLDPARAGEAYATALARAPGTALAAEAEAGLGQALAERGRAEEAREHLERALGLAPDAPRALHALAWLLATSEREELRDPKRAAELLDRCRARGEAPNWMHLHVLAAVLAAQGRYPDAVRAAAEAEAHAPAAEWPRLRAERHEYEAGRALVR